MQGNRAVAIAHQPPTRSSRTEGPPAIATAPHPGSSGQYFSSVQNENLKNIAQTAGDLAPTAIL
ncbi:hypothetical protein [Laspinema olomoucense]|uniref:hypothetical protein n=1 Tax=Laspinema olomoucense TaxID=3231600 RepID=UPI0021BA4F06|nr:MULTISPECIES: hypothetical protein [unclassified Laspinema]MCT7987715.1 hypothetical protein [Laspinema sp. D3a]MCT7996519.1 hypothetical protein [Laspinema sp. D3c]